MLAWAEQKPKSEPAGDKASTYSRNPERLAVVAGSSFRLEQRRKLSLVVQVDKWSECHKMVYCQGLEAPPEIQRLLQTRYPPFFFL